MGSMKKQRNWQIAAIFMVFMLAFTGSTAIFVVLSSNAMMEFVTQATDLYIEDISTRVDTFLNEPKSLTKSLSRNQDFIKLATSESYTSFPQLFNNSIASILGENMAYQNCTGVYYVSVATHALYTQNGFVKILGWDDPEYLWFSDLLKETTFNNRIDLDYGKIQNLNVIVHTYYKVKTNDGKVLGIVGMEYEDRDMRERIQAPKSSPDMHAYLTDPNGNVLISPDIPAGVPYNFLSAGSFLEGYSAEELFSTSERTYTWKEAEGGLRGDRQLYAVSYLKEMDCFLIVQNLNSASYSLLNRQVTAEIILSFILIMVGAVIVMILISVYRREIIRVATEDELTGLPNRKYFTEWFENKYKQGNKEKSLFLLDIDKFKGINDTYGHAGGDMALKTLAAHIRSMTDHKVYPGRWGGDEFIGVINAPVHEAGEMLQKMSAGLKNEFINDTFHITISIGLVSMSYTTDLYTLCGLADQALYQAKEAGRDCLKIYSSGANTAPGTAELKRRSARLGDQPN